VSRLAILTASLLLGLGACVKTGPQVAGLEGCQDCHVPHDPARVACVSCHRGDPTAERKELAHYRLISGKAAEHGLADAPAVVEGRKLVDTLACRRCHSVGGAGNRLATNLDRVAWKRDQSALMRSIREPVENMPKFGLRALQTEAVIASLLNGADPGLAEATYRVRFASREAARSSRFDERCGGCHRAILAGAPAGRGSAGPNLSGLFTREYPFTASGAGSWTPAAVKSWLQNPRALRCETTMRPVVLEEWEWPRLIDELGGFELGDAATASRSLVRPAAAGAS
jgi:cytochrome c2